MNKRTLVLAFVAGITLFSTTQTVTASDSEYGNFHNIYQLKQFSDIKSANKFMNNHGCSTLVGYDRKTETTVTNEITEFEIENADEKFIVQYETQK